jgi:quercetin dioxygenase-like cupin family protein
MERRVEAPIGSCLKEMNTPLPRSLTAKKWLLNFLRDVRWVAVFFMFFIKICADTMNNFLPTPKVVRHGEGQCLPLLNEVRYQLLDGNETGGAVALAKSEFEYQGGSPLHVHTREDELFFIEGGEFSFQIGGTETVMRAGDFVFAPRLVAHSYQCISTEGGCLMIAVIQAGFEGFFREMADKLEAGHRVSPTEMHAMAANYGVYMDGFDGLDAPGAAPQIVGANEGERLEAFGDKVRVLLAGGSIGGCFCVSESETHSHSGPPLHLHESEDETFVIRAGRYEFQIEDQLVEVGVGDVIFAPRGVPHTFRVVSSEPGRFLLIATPGGFDDFFREATAMFASGTVTPQGIGEMSAKYGIRYLPVAE